MWLWSVHTCFQRYKNYKNRPKNARVVVENNVASFFPDTVYIFQWLGVDPWMHPNDNLARATMLMSAMLHYHYRHQGKWPHCEQCSKTWQAPQTWSTVIFPVPHSVFASPVPTELYSVPAGSACRRPETAPSCTCQSHIRIYPCHSHTNNLFTRLETRTKKQMCPLSCEKFPSCTLTLVQLFPLPHNHFPLQHSSLTTNELSRNLFHNNIWTVQFMLDSYTLYQTFLVCTKLKHLTNLTLYHARLFI